MSKYLAYQKSSGHVHVALSHIRGKGDVHQGGCQENEKE